MLIEEESQAKAWLSLSEVLRWTPKNLIRS